MRAFGQNTFPEHLQREAREKPFFFFFKQAISASGIFALLNLIQILIMPSWVPDRTPGRIVFVSIFSGCGLAWYFLHVARKPAPAGD